ncbi:hypothetical protein ACFY2R_03870 [Micromonospora olivasterospora]|uniref:Uncharacterized protein n=1 Tax=Micromonospora olivasterospora TaxID=1880 RepID=A0A562IF26_MICOL|nr:hypothetical protein [Micromonospora olivasterospora]TWH69305.1 hypothetical protein JD77_04314 [Micromonospora olivasterospora]
MLHLRVIAPPDQSAAVADLLGAPTRGSPTWWCFPARPGYPGAT